MKDESERPPVTGERRTTVLIHPSSFLLHPFPQVRPSRIEARRSRGSCGREIAASIGVRNQVAARWFREPGCGPATTDEVVRTLIRTSFVFEQGEP
jgi:hypothetical protein